MAEFGRLSMASRMLLATGMLGTFGTTSAGEPISMPEHMQMFGVGDDPRSRWERQRRAENRAIVYAYQAGKRPRHIAKERGISKQRVISILQEEKVWNG